MIGKATELNLYRRKDLGKPPTHLMQRYHKPSITSSMKRRKPSVYPTDAIKGDTLGLTPVSACSRVADQPYSVGHVDLQRRIYAEHNKTFKRESLLGSRVSQMTQVLVSISRRSIRSNS
jgi:hypothetical protein